MCGGGGGKGGGGGVKGDTVAHRLKVLRSPAPNASRDPLRFHTICAAMNFVNSRPQTFFDEKLWPESVVVRIYTKPRSGQH